MDTDILTEEEDHILDQIGELEEAGDVEAIKAFIERYPAIFQKRHGPDDRLGVLWHRLYSACVLGHLELIKFFVGMGASIHLNMSDRSQEGIIESVAGHGYLEVMHWLLDQGVVFQQVINGNRTSRTLISSALRGQRAEVELLLDRGAPVNGLATNGLTALDFALMYNHTEVADLLRSRGGQLGWEVLGTGPPKLPPPPATIRAHLATTLGTPDALTLHEILPNELPIVIHHVVAHREHFLVTEGMSAIALTPPEGHTGPRFAEVHLRLPMEWPLTPEALADPSYGWPVALLRRVARLPHLDPTFWLDKQGTLLAETVPPQPLAPGTPMTHLLAVETNDPWGKWKRPGAEPVSLIFLFPIHPDEKEFALQNGVKALVELFHEALIPLTVNPMRPSILETV